MTGRGPSRPSRSGYLRTSEAADILHVSPKTLSRWAKEGKLPYVRTLGGHRRYPEDEIRALLHREEATSGPLAETTEQ